METLTLSIKDTGILPRLLKTLNGFEGVSVIGNSCCRYSDVSYKTDGCDLVRETLVPAIRDVIEAKKKGMKYPDAHDILNMLDD